MNWKEFLKPTLIKVILFLILFIPTSLFLTRSTSKSTWSVGFPFGIYSCIVGDNSPMCSISPSYEFMNFNLSNYAGWMLEGLLLNIIIWYLVSCLIIWIFNKSKKKK